MPGRPGFALKSESRFWRRVASRLPDRGPLRTILFSAPLTATPADLDRMATEWAMGNYVRIAVVLTTVILVIASLVRISRDTAPAQTE